MSHASITVTVDAQLHWVLRVPEVLAGATRASSAAQLARSCAELDALPISPTDVARADTVVETIARVVIELLSGPPDLPYIGEPFGGDGGTD
jgi:hypothetical protein